MKKSAYILCFLLLIFFILPLQTFALTHVTTDVMQNTIWDSSHSPYIIDNSIVIRPNTTLTILPGVTVKNNNSILTVLGTLSAQGTVNQKIYFQPNSVTSNQWGMEFANSASSTLSNVDFLSANKGITIHNSKLILNSVSYASSTSPIDIFNESTVYCFKCSLSNISSNSAAINVYNGSNLSLNDSTLSSSNNFLSVYDASETGSSTLEIENTTLDNAAHNGIAIYGNAFLHVKNSTIKNSGQNGILGYGNGVVTISSSTIEHNLNGLYIYHSLTGSLSSSTIKDNHEYGILSQAQNSFNAQNNWWGTSTGPYNEVSNPSGGGNSISENVLFNPWRRDVVSTTTLCCSNVLFIPGFEASRLYTQGIVSENQLWEPNRNADVEKLFLDSKGKSLNNSIYTRDIITNTNYPAFNKSIYSHFENELNSLVENKSIHAWLPYAYDWRNNIQDIATSDELLNHIKVLAASSKTGKVSIITHSNGGLIAKALVQFLEAKGLEPLIDTVIMVATPQRGTPESITGLLHGDDQSFAYGLLLNKSTARAFGLNMPGAYNLLPSAQYFSSTKPIITFNQSSSNVSNLRDSYGETITTYPELLKFLASVKDNRIQPGDRDLETPSVLNDALLNKAQKLHKNLDSYVFPSSIKVYNIIGYGIPTLESITYISGHHCLNLKCLDHIPTFSDKGDGTVLNESSILAGANNSYFNLSSYNKINKENISHPTILENKSILEYIETILVKDGLHQIAEFSGLKPESSEIDYVSIGVHSPVSLDLYNSHGRHTGFASDGDTSSTSLHFIEAEIPNSYYKSFGEGQYAGYSDMNTEINLKGNGNGTFSLDINKIQNGSSSAYLFEDVPVLTSTEARVTFKENNEDPVLHMDYDGDGKEDTIIKASEKPDIKVYLLQIKAALLGFSLKPDMRNHLLQSIDRLITLENSDKTKKFNNRIQNFLKQITKKTNHTKHLSLEERESLIVLIQQLSLELDKI